jgi:Na+/H+-dicarboxylate symporter
MIVLYLIIFGMVSGLIVGAYVDPQTVQSIDWIGTLFLNALRMTIVPLIMAAVITGIASLGDVRKLGKPGGLTILYYLSTTFIAVIIGLFFVNIMLPGEGLNMVAQSGIAERPETGATDIILSMVSPNLIRDAVNMQLLPLVFFSILFGAAATTTGAIGKPVLNFFEGLNEVMMRIVGWIMYLSPLGVFALVAVSLSNAAITLCADDPTSCGLSGGEALSQTIKSVGGYVATVLIALAVHAVVLYLILTGIAKRGFSFLKDMARALLTAFGTASSSATLPLTMECAQEHGLSPRSVRFVIPLGSTVNMNGTALYEAVAALFIAQAYGVDLTLQMQIIVALTSTMAAIGAAGIPNAGTVTMLIVLSAVGLPAEGIGMLLGVDWFLDRFRTSVNVWGDAVGAAVMNKYMINADANEEMAAIDAEEKTAVNAES